MRFRSWMALLPAIALFLTGCDLAALASRVGNPHIGFTIQFPEAKWRLDAGALNKMPAFVNTASRFHCELDRCGRRVVAFGVYGQTPNAGRKLAPGELPRYDDVVTIMAAFLNIRGALRTDNLRLLTINKQDAYQVTLTQHERVGPIFTQANIVFYENRFLLWGVTTQSGDRSIGEALIDEISRTLKVPGPAA